MTILIFLQYMPPSLVHFQEQRPPEFDNKI
jgi:hypothetical protein